MPAIASNLRVRVVAGLLLFKLAYFGLLVGAMWLCPNLDQQLADGLTERWFRLAAPGWQPPGGTGFGEHFATWDAEHYLFLSQEGYRAGVPSCAFYPLWPVLIRWASVLTGGSRIVAGLALANLFSLAGWLIFFEVTARRFGESAAACSLALLITFPGALFFQFIYTEPLFFLLLMLLWRGLEQKNYRLAWTAGFLLPLTRGVGLFCVLPIAWHFLMRQNLLWPERFERWKWLRAERERLCGLTGWQGDSLNEREPRAFSGARPLVSVAFGSAPREQAAESAIAIMKDPPPKPAGTGCGAPWQDFVLILAPLVGFAGYLLLMQIWTGNAFEGFTAQKYWAAHSIGNLWNLPKFIIGFFTPISWHEFRGSVLDRCAFLLLLYSLPLMWRLGKDLVIWTYVLGVLPAMSGTFVSFTRFESVAFPVFIAFGVFFSRLRPKWPFLSFLTACAVLHAVLLWRFVNFRWAG